MTEGAGLRVERHDRVALVVLDRPDRRNAIDRDTRALLATTLAALDDDSEIRVVVVTGTGSAFCAGVDLKDAPTGDDPAWIGAEALVAPLERFSKPLVAAVNGPAVGGGFEIALCCEIRLASPEASFALPEVRIGSMPGSGGTQRIFGALPSAVAWRIVLTGSPLGAEDALRFGLVTDLVESDRLVDEALALAARIAEGAPLSLAAIKQAGRVAGSPGGAELERALWGLLSTTEDRAEGRAAFREKRPPEYRGR
jgi:enoyl-CoA hydratase/carnithine racemase